MEPDFDTKEIDCAVLVFLLLARHSLRAVSALAAFVGPSLPLRMTRGGAAGLLLQAYAEGGFGPHDLRSELDAIQILRRFAPQDDKVAEMK